MPRTWVTGEIVSASQLNIHLRDNTLDLDRRTTIVAEYVVTSQTTASTSYAALATAGPAATVTVGATGKALISIACDMNNNTAAQTAFMAFQVTGATTRAASDEEAAYLQSAIAGAGGVMGNTILLPGLTPGVNTFTSLYRVNAGTGTFKYRRLLVTPMGS